MEEEQPEVFERTVRFDASATYMEGKYGTETTTKLWYFPGSLTIFFKGGDLRGTVPYIQETSTGVVSIVDGRVVPTPVPPTTPNSTNIPFEEKREGMGDATADLTIYAVKTEHGTFVNLTGGVKFPTADEEEGLGTGEYDYYAGAELSQALGKYFVLSVNGRHTWIGEPEGVELENQLSGNAGIGNRIGTHFFHGVYYDRRTSIVKDVEDSESVYYYVDISGKHGGIYGSAEAGLSDQAPDWAATVGLHLDL